MTVRADGFLFGQPDPLTESDFLRLAKHIHSRSGIKMPPSKRSFLEGRLRRRLLALGLESYAAYCAYLFDQNGLSTEEHDLIEAVTTHKTDFFREPHHFEYLERQVLPELHNRPRCEPVRGWSAGCSHGAEPYTIAMVCETFAENHPGFQYSLQASDLSRSVLACAERAVYPHADIEPVPMELRKRYLLRDPHSDEVRIRPELRSKVTFHHLNLLDDAYGHRFPLDIIFCRNVLIYFDKPTQKNVLTKLCAALRDGGVLFLGHSESIAGMSLPLRPMGGTIFLKESADCIKETVG